MICVLLRIPEPAVDEYLVLQRRFASFIWSFEIISWTDVHTSSLMAPRQVRARSEDRSRVA